MRPENLWTEGYLPRAYAFIWCCLWKEHIKHVKTFKVDQTKF